ncbi:MAG: terminase small subunit [Burkholderiaceae bacterium]
MNLNTTCTQAQFGELVGIGQPAVSDLMARDVLAPGQTAGQWLRDYCAHLREMAAGRGMDGELAYQRAELARVSRERAEIKLKVERAEFAPVALIEQVLASMGRGVAGLLEPLPAHLHKLCPALTPDDVRVVQAEISKACDLAAAASLALLDTAEEEGGTSEPADDGETDALFEDDQ